MVVSLGLLLALIGAEVLSHKAADQSSATKFTLGTLELIFGIVICIGYAPPFGTTTGIMTIVIGLHNFWRGLKIRRRKLPSSI
jgi:hypothetical protein